MLLSFIIGFIASAVLSAAVVEVWFTKLHDKIADLRQQLAEANEPGSFDLHIERLREGGFLK